MGGYAVVIVTHDSSQWLDGCLGHLGESALSTPIVVVDNASTDHSVEIARSRPSVRLIENNQNMGFGYACNSGVAALSAFPDISTIIFLNPDTRPDRTVLEALHDFLCENRQYGAVGPLQRDIRGSLSMDSTGQYNEWTRKAVVGRALFPADQSVLQPMPLAEFEEWLVMRSTTPIAVSYVNGAALAVRRDIFEYLGGFDTGYFLFFEEVDLCRRIDKLGYRVALLPDLSIEHAWGGHGRGERLGHWLTSKYRLIAVDPMITKVQRIGIFFRHLKQDLSQSVSLGYRPFGRALMTALAHTVCNIGNLYRQMRINAALDPRTPDMAQ